MTSILSGWAVILSLPKDEALLKKTSMVACRRTKPYAYTLDT